MSARSSFGRGAGLTESGFGHAGGYWDVDLGFYDLRARWMDPEHGRFASMDTWSGDFERPLSLHKYLYAHGDPVNGSDPSGRTTLLDLDAA